MTKKTTALDVWKSHRELTKVSRLSLTDALKAVAELASEEGRRNFPKFIYVNTTKEIYANTFDNYKRNKKLPKNTRDQFTSDQLLSIIRTEQNLADKIWELLKTRLTSDQIYSQIKHTITILCDIYEKHSLPPLIENE